MNTTPITTYVAPTASWEPWYEEYRYGALYLFPPPGVRAEVNALRQRYDPRSQAICDAHISLTVPLPRPLMPADAAELAGVAQAHAPFEVRWGPPFQYPGVAGVVLRIEPAPALQQLVTALETCGCFRGAVPRRYPFSPHMTIAEFITLDESEALVEELRIRPLSGRFECPPVTLAVPDQTFRFTERVAWPVGVERGTLPGSHEREGTA
jgi:2'-5' RNA ligase